LVTRVYCDACGEDITEIAPFRQEFEGELYEFCKTCHQVARELRRGMSKSFIEDIKALREAGVEGTPKAPLKQMETRS